MARNSKCSATKELAIVIGSEELGYSPAGETVDAFLGTDIASMLLAEFGSKAQKAQVV